MTVQIPCGRVMGHGESCVEGYLCDQCAATTQNGRRWGVWIGNQNGSWMTTADGIVITFLHKKCAAAQAFIQHRRHPSSTRLGCIEIGEDGSPMFPTDYFGPAPSADPCTEADTILGKLVRVIPRGFRLVRKLSNDGWALCDVKGMDGDDKWHNSPEDAILAVLGRPA